MRDRTKLFNFFETYETASLIEGAATDLSSFIEIEWDSMDVMNCLYKYSRVTILHYYIYAILSTIKRDEYRKNTYDLLPSDIEPLKHVFEEYGIELNPDNELESTDEDDYYYISNWFNCHESSFEALWEAITEEVFHILFANRGFLLLFNISLSDYLEKGDVKIPKNMLNNRDRIKRQTYIPSWTKKAIFYRDHGRCVLCQKDLSGLISTDRRVQYDHIVPLNLFGVNDPCNLQLLCEQCNLRKSGNQANTGLRYPTWWD